MDSNQVNGLQNHTARRAIATSGDSLWNRLRSALFLTFLLVYEKLSLVGEIGMGTGVAIIAIFWFLIYLEHTNSLQGVSNKMNFSKNYWNLLCLLFLCLIRQELDIRTALVATMNLGCGIPEIVMSRLAATPSLWFDFLLLMYLIAYFLMFSSLILKFKRRGEPQRKLMAGVACTCAILGIISIIVSFLPTEFARVFILGMLLVPAALYVYAGAD